MKRILDQQFSKKNFFYSADSEHYQDAVLTYIFYNYPEPGKIDSELSEIERFSKYFTSLFIGDSANGSIITHIDVETQVFDSDIDLIVHTADGKDHLVIIEDKTGSSIHRSKKNKKMSTNVKNSNPEYYDTQLEKYYDMFIQSEDYQKYFKDGRIHLFYYRNEYVNKYEHNKLSAAKEGCKDILFALFKEKIQTQREELLEYEKKYRINPKGNTANAIKTRKEKIANFEKLTIEFAACYEKYGDAVVEWKINDIDWIYDAFDNFFKDIEPENLILKEYFESIKFWKNEIDTIVNQNYTIERSLEDDLKWGDRSKLWNPVFSQMVESSLECIQYEPFDTKVQSYTGRYWEMSIHAKDKRTCMIASTKGIKNDSFTVDINLRNAKYDGEENVPSEWNVNDGKREEDRKTIIDAIKDEIIDNVEPKITSRKSKGDQDSNKICSYEFKFKPEEKPDYDTLFKYWMKVLELFVNKIDGIS